MLITYIYLLLFILAVMGIEFAYAAETAFVSPTLLGIGIQHRNMVQCYLYFYTYSTFLRNIHVLF